MYFMFMLNYAYNLLHGRLPCTYKNLIKLVCFSPINLSLSFQFLDLATDTKRVKENCFFPYNTNAKTLCWSGTLLISSLILTEITREYFDLTRKASIPCGKLHSYCSSGLICRCLHSYLCLCCAHCHEWPLPPA